jgi:hypothetical protein
VKWNAEMQDKFRDIIPFFGRRFKNVADKVFPDNVLVILDWFFKILCANASI